jgi:hypothetical protein
MANLPLKQKFDVIFSSKFMDKIEVAYPDVKHEVVLALNSKKIKVRDQISAILRKAIGGPHTSAR